MVELRRFEPPRLKVQATKASNSFCLRGTFTDLLTSSSNKATSSSNKASARSCEISISILTPSVDPYPIVGTPAAQRYDLSSHPSNFLISARPSCDISLKSSILFSPCSVISDFCFLCTTPIRSSQTLFNKFCTYIVTLAVVWNGK